MKFISFKLDTQAAICKNIMRDYLEALKIIT